VTDEKGRTGVASEFQSLKLCPLSPSSPAWSRGSAVNDEVDAIIDRRLDASQSPEDTASNPTSRTPMVNTCSVPSILIMTTSW
tara:strand:+ start:33540 stop:33788 length:249 start_codon:yes stop_codon:yes gene_type:complete